MRPLSAQRSAHGRSSDDCVGVYRRALQDHKLTVASGLIATIAQAVAVLPIPLLVRHGVDVAIPRGQRGSLIAVSASIVALTAATGVSAVLGQWWIQKATKEATARLRQRVAEQVFRADYALLGDLDGAATHERLLADPARVEALAGLWARQLLPSALTVAGLAVVLLRIDVLLTVITAIIVPLIVATTRTFRRPLERTATDIQASFEDLARNALVAIRSQPLIRSRGASWDERQLLHDRVRRLQTTTSRRMVVVGLLSAVQTTVVSMATAVTLAAGGIAVMSGRITLGDLLSFFASVALIRSPIMNLATASSTVIEGRQSAARIDRFLAEVVVGPPVVRSAQRGPHPARLSLERVTYAYPGYAPVVEDFSLSLEPGKVTALAGPNGAGKSTIMALLLGLLHPQSGQVLVDGAVMDADSFERVRQHLGVSFQQTDFFPGTVRHNLMFGRSWASADDIADAVRDADAASLIDHLPDGLESWIGGNGDRLSGGERQRLAIARAIIGRPSIVVLDEPSNHLPTKVVERILERLRYWPRPPAVLLISHDISVLAAADITVRVGSTGRDLAAS